MTITPEQLVAQLDSELAPLPVSPRLRYPELQARAARRRSRRRHGYVAGGVALLAAAAAAVSLVIVTRPAPRASVLPVAPVSYQPMSAPAAAGDVDGDGRPDQVSISGRSLTVVGTRVGTLRLTLSQAGDTLAGRPVDIGDSGFADIVVRSTDFPGERYVLVALATARGGRPTLGVVAQRDGRTPDLLADGAAGIEQSWTCQAGDGALNRPGLLVTASYDGSELTRTSYRLAGVLATQVATTTAATTSSVAAREVAAETLCATGGGTTTAPPGVAPSTSGGEVAAYGGIDGEQLGTGVVPDGTGLQTSYAGRPLVRRTFQGGSVEVPSGWVETNATLASDHSDYLFYDPANPTARFEVSESGCVGCASKGGDDVTPDPSGPPATVSSVALSSRTVAFTERPWLGYAVNGVDTILTGAQNGATGPIGGYALYRVALPMDDAALETTILNSVRLT